MSPLCHQTYVLPCGGARPVNTPGTVEAEPQSGDTRSRRILEFSGVIPASDAAQKDDSLVELAEMLRTEHRASSAASIVWR